MSIAATADELTPESRHFFENAKMKMASSIIWAAGAMFMLGLTAIAGGEAKGYGALRDNASSSSTIDDNVKASYAAMASGYGFACFVFMVGFVLFFSAAIFVSPSACGSANEKLTVKKPLELSSVNAMNV